MGRLTPKKILADLIAIPSVNPAFLPRGDQRSGEKDAGIHLAGLARKRGLEVEHQEVLPGRSNLIVRLSPTGSIRHRLLLAPHLDTVGGEGLNKSYFQPREKQGRLHGRGACDTKGSAAAMFCALLEVAEGGQRPRHTEIIFTGLIDEESGQAGSRALTRRIPKADLAIVGEPTGLELVTAHKGTYWIRFSTEGVSAHGSKPQLGVNAIHEMARVVDLLEGTYRKNLGRRRHPLLGHGTMNVGTIQGGTQPNIVPSQCQITADRRTLPGETEASVRRELQQLFKTHRLRVQISNTQPDWCPAMESSPGHDWVGKFQKILGQRRSRGVDYFCDAAVLAEAGIPSVVFGPGDIAQAHTADEWIELRQLEGAVARLKRFLQSLP